MSAERRGVVVILPDDYERTTLPDVEGVFGHMHLDVMSDVSRLEAPRAGAPEAGVRTLRRVGVVVADAERSEEVAKYYSEVPGAAVLEDRRVRAYPSVVDAVAVALGDSPTETWARTALNLGGCRWTGRGAKVAVLDSGYASAHPDFAGRPVATAVFNGAPSPGDLYGHGTHCLGLVGGPAVPSRGPRYGVAPNASLYVGKVLGDDGQGWISDVLTGLNWALAQGCDVVSLALGWQDDDPAQVAGFETVASRALTRGCLIVAAAGNESARPALVSPVSFPASAPSVLAVAALDTDLSVDIRSNRGSAGGPQIDLAAPGAAMWSTWPQATYQTADGTSMATSFVAGVAALWKESSPSLGGRSLWAAMTAASAKLPYSSEDVGAGLVQAPS